MALKQKGKRGGLEGMEGVARLMKEGAHVAVHSDRIHEDEGQLSEGEGLAVTTRRLALAVVQVEQLRLGDPAVVAAELRFDMCKYVAGSIDQGRDVREGLQWRAAAQGVQSHMPAPPPHQPLDRRQHRRFNGLVKTQAVVRRVVETILIEVRKVAIVCEAGVSGDLLSQVVHAVEDAREHPATLDVRLGPQPEGAFSHRAVG